MTSQATFGASTPTHTSPPPSAHDAAPDNDITLVVLVARFGSWLRN
jgi:hypothetical protein